MNFAKRILMYVGFVVLAAILISVLAPKATHALVATLVQVSNTPSSPVPNKDVDSPAHATIVPLGCQAFGDPETGELICTLGVGTLGQGSISPYTVPAGQRLVLEQVAAFCQTQPDGSIPFVNFNITEAGVLLAEPLALTSKQNDEFVTQAVRYYADPGSTLSLQALGPGSGAFCDFTASGYLVSYP
jgi:hypothetical protein